MHGHSTLASLGIRPRRRLSQSFLEDQRVAAAIVRAAHIQPLEDVLEVGPGLGVLTRGLVQHARRVVAVEIDELLAEQLRTELSVPNLTVCSADVLQTNITSLFDGPFVVVANLPYHITSPVLRHLLRAEPTRMVVMVQREVGERIAACAGRMSALSVLIQAQARVEVLRHVPKTAFYPRPKVDSVVLRLSRLDEPVVAPGELNAFTELVQAGFKQPRKQLGNSFADGRNLDKAAALGMLQRADINPSRRPQELGVADWVRLFEVAQTA
ncbi:MAG: ribosomal RNA small subunit methyltransferase A [Chloroflexi bacterium]|nr:ribosomal RNA small subunit methyltransferase A [Chloroflexota bacterium]